MKLQITIDGKTYEVEVEALEDDSPSHMPSYETYHPAVPMAQPVQFPGSFGQAAITEEGVDESKVCRSPVMGIVIRVLVEPEQTVEASDMVMVLEAMKMETSVSAPYAGKVKAVRVQPGDSVKMGQVLVEFE